MRLTDTQKAQLYALTHIILVFLLPIGVIIDIITMGFLEVTKRIWRLID